MQKQSARVVIASEYPQAWYFLSRVIEQEGEVNIVGQAQDASKALTLVKSLRPDIAVIDCHLPHDAALDAIPMSRINGLDTAQAILEEIPNIRVILLNNLDMRVLSDRSLSSNATVAYSIESMGTNISFALQDRGDRLVSPKEIIFASFEVKQQVALQQKVTSISDKVIFFGALGIAGGWLLTLTMIFLPIGVPLALAGGAAVLLGLAGKLTTSLRRKVRSSARGA